MKIKSPFQGVILLAVAFLFVFQFPAYAQETTDPGITIYQYRHVSADKRAEFVKRETTYWAEVAQKATAKGNLTFWALLEKIGGSDLENGSNYLFINTYKNIDAIGEVWSGAAAAFPNVTMDKMETNSLSKTTSMFYLRNGDWQQAATAAPEKDFNYISMVYHHADNPRQLLDLEAKHWGPFIKAAMDKNQTSQKAWGNAIVLSPSGPDLFNTVSYDLYPTLKEALNPTWDAKAVFPQEGLKEINDAETKGRGGAVYRIVKVVSVN